MTEINTENPEVKEVKSTLAQKHQEKEDWFHKKDALKQEIFAAIKEIQEVKKQLDAARSIQQKWKTERDKCNKITKELIAQIKPLQNEVPVKQTGPYVDVSGLQRMIARLEMNIETEVMKFEKEKELMTKIKKLKKQLGEGLGAVEGRQQYMHLSKEIREAKKKADEYHKKFMEEREKDKDNLEKFAVLTKKINQLKKEQEEVIKKCLTFKQEYSHLAQEAHGKFEEERTQRRASTEKYQKDRQAQEQRRQEQTKRLLEERSKSVEEKLKTRKKLTTEDLIAFQGLDKKD